MYMRDKKSAPIKMTCNARKINLQQLTEINCHQYTHTSTYI